jgi:hypothetical protein
MPELGLMQEMFAAALADSSRAAHASELFRGAPGEATARLAVYRGNVVSNARKALANAYPIAVKIVGAEFFEGLSRDTSLPSSRAAISALSASASPISSPRFPTRASVLARRRAHGMAGASRALREGRRAP